MEFAMVKLSLAGVIAGLVLLVTTAATDSAGNVAASCQRRAVPAVINASFVCLKTGGSCKARFQRQYARYGFYCGSGLLAKRRKTTPPAATAPPATTTTPPASPPPPSPFTGTWWAIDVTDGSLEQLTFGDGGTMYFRDDSVHTCGGAWGYAMTSGAANGNTWTASERTTLFCPDNGGAVPDTLFQFSSNTNGTLSMAGSPDVWTRTHP
jgi:hypothetical protein